ncbi:MAG: hypothetical protein COV45_09235 [Deltaproteobacteria bacterium CG11_big_fil_rev_8_21_14_0_20_47_16]|nr:MAG: hypothetical protein COV45_09235 [Deltaproteobacteria bacterium CG11_big_fil_rev_8_21_14_0_20_47_16]
MTLAFGSMHRLNRILLKTKDVLGDGDATLTDENKNASLQYAASFYSLYGGDGSEAVYADKSDLTILQSELIATAAAIELINTAISYYKDDVVEATAGPADAKFRQDKLAWLKTLLEELENKLSGLKSQLGYAESELSGPPALLRKVRACEDPPGDVCPCD